MAVYLFSFVKDKLRFLSVCKFLCKIIWTATTFHMALKCSLNSVKAFITLVTAVHGCKLRSSIRTVVYIYLVGTVTVVHFL